MKEDSAEVLHILGDETARLIRRPGEELAVGHRTKIWALCDRDDIVPTLPQSLGDHRRMHLVEKQRHADAWAPT
jgi:hypothetical protein